MDTLSNLRGHDWLSFALGAAFGIVCIFAIKRYNKRKDV